MENVETNVQMNTPRTPSEHITNETISAEHADLKVKPDTVRLRWFPWIEKVAPTELLKEGKGYTPLARELFADYAQQVKRQGVKPEEWVKDAKHRYSQEWGNAGVIDAELVPEEVGGTLALMHSQTSSLQTKLEQELASLDEFTDSLAAIGSNLSDAELQAAKAKGAMRGIQKFKVETLTELETYNRLQQDRLRREAGQ